MNRAVGHLSSSDPRLAALVARIGPCRIRCPAPAYSMLARSIAGQRFSGQASAAFYARIRSAAGGAVTPASILRLGAAGLTACGASRNKAGTLLALAAHVSAGHIRFARLRRLPDHEVIARLTAVQGLGEWTAQMFLIFALRRPDVLPCQDAGIRRAFRLHCNLNSTPTPSQVREIGRPWHPFASYAAWYLWWSLDLEARL